MALAALIGPNRHGADLQFIHHQPAARHRDQALLRQQAHAQAIAQAQFLLPVLSRPEPPKAGLIEGQAGLEKLRSQKLGSWLVCDLGLCLS